MEYQTCTANCSPTWCWKLWKHLEVLSWGGGATAEGRYWQMSHLKGESGHGTERSWISSTRLFLSEGLTNCPAELAAFILQSLGNVSAVLVSDTPSTSPHRGWWHQWWPWQCLGDGWTGGSWRSSPTQFSGYINSRFCLQNQALDPPATLRAQMGEMFGLSNLCRAQREKNITLHFWEYEESKCPAHNMHQPLFYSAERITVPTPLSSQHTDLAQTLCQLLSSHPCPNSLGRLTTSRTVRIKPSLPQRAQLPTLGVPPCPFTQPSLPGLQK